MSMRTPFARVTGLGSAKEGAHHFWQQRVTAAANLLLAIFFAWLVIAHIGASRAELVASFQNPVIAALTVLLLVSVAIHMRLGIQVVIEDYIHKESTKIILFVLTRFFAYGMAAIGVVSVLMMSFGG